MNTLDDVADSEPCDRPILFSAPMVRALLAGTKTQTRRVVKGIVEDVRPPDWHAPRRLVHKTTCQRSFCEQVDDGELACGGFEIGVRGCARWPYGGPGDRLWVRETTIIAPKNWGDIPPTHRNGVRDAEGEERLVQYLATAPHREAADSFKLKATPSIFMPRWACRITLEITEVRVERLNEISQEDAAAEGVLTNTEGLTTTDEVKNPTRLYRYLWESINGEGSWAKNPWVWCLSFRRVTP